MHILLLTPNFPPEGNACATRSYEHARRWVQAGHQVTVVTPVPNWPSGRVHAGYRNGWRREKWVEGMRVLHVWTLVRANRGFLARVASFASFMLRATWCAYWVRQVDVVVATSPHFFCGLAGMFTRWLTRRPLVLEVRDLWPESIVAVGAMRRSWMTRALESLERAMYRSANHLVTVGDSYRDQLLKRKVPPHKITVVPNGVDVAQWPPLEADLQLRHRWKGRDRFVCGYVGTVGMAHGLEVVLRAAGQLQRQGRHEIVFWIVGDGASRVRLQADVQRLGLDNVLLTGQVPKSQVARVIASCDACLVHLRDNELFATVVPSKIFEIMALNRPIILGVRGPALSLVTSAGAGMAMTPEKATSLIAGIDQVRRQPQRYRQGREFVRRNFQRARFAAEMLQVLGQVAGRPMPFPTADSNVVSDRPWRPAA